MEHSDKNITIRMSRMLRTENDILVFLNKVSTSGTKRGKLNMKQQI